MPRPKTFVTAVASASARAGVTRAERRASAGRVANRLDDHVRVEKHGYTRRVALIDRDLFRGHLVLLDGLDARSVTIGDLGPQLDQSIMDRLIDAFELPCSRKPLGFHLAQLIGVP